MDNAQREAEAIVRKWIEGQLLRYDEFAFNELQEAIAKAIRDAEKRTWGEAAVLIDVLESDSFSGIRSQRDKLLAIEHIGVIASEFRHRAQTEADDKPD